MNAPLSAQQLAEIRARAEAATPGPWGTYDDGTGRIDIAADLEETGHGYTCRRSIAQTDDEPIDNDPGHVDWDSDDDLEQIEADAEFIAHAREDAPALLAEVDRLTAERDQFADRVDTLTAVAKSNKRHVQELTADLYARDRRVAELEAERHTTNEALHDAVERNAKVDRQLADVRDAVAEAVMCADGSCLNRSHLPKLERILGGVNLLHDGGAL